MIELRRRELVTEEILTTAILGYSETKMTLI